MKKFAIFILVFVVLALVYSYHQARQNALGEALVSNAYYGDLTAVKENLEEGAPLSHVLYFDDEDRQYTGGNLMPCRQLRPAATRTCSIF